MKHLIFAVALGAAAGLAGATWAEPVEYTVYAGHSQVDFAFDHFGFSTTWNSFPEVGGTLIFDQEHPENSSVSVAFPLRSMWTGSQGRYARLMGPNFFDADEESMVTFVSTSIEVTGENTGKITGTLTVNGVAHEEVLDAVLNLAAKRPTDQVEAVGFSATATVLRSDFNVDKYVPYISDELQVRINLEAKVGE